MNPGLTYPRSYQNALLSFPSKQKKHYNSSLNNFGFYKVLVRALYSPLVKRSLICDALRGLRVFHIFYIAQIISNRATHHKETTYTSCLTGRRAT